MLLTAIPMFSQEGQKTGAGQADLLSAAGAISVTIGGYFITNGTFTASQYERADQFITRMFNMSKLQSWGSVTDKSMLDEISVKLESYARRNIKLKRISGETVNLDLEKFRLTGDFKYNPYLKNEDVIIFPKYDTEREFVAIDGAVNNSVKFQFVEGDKLSDAILFAQGISRVYENVKTAEISRLSYDGTHEDIIKADIDSDVKLQAGDRIRVLADETNRKDYRVLVLGEVNKPGYISIAKDHTTVREVIAKAGGFKSTASLDNSELIRGVDSYSLYKKNMLTKSYEQNKYTNLKMESSLYDNTKMEQLLMSRMSYLTEEDTLYFKVDNELRLLRGSGLVDFTHLADDTSASSSFIVKDSDVILVPEKNDVVYIFGQVMNPGYVKYKEGMDISYYIKQSGGLGELARDMEEISVIKAKSRSWITLSSNKVQIEPGDYIWVPKKTPRTFSFYLQRVGSIASVVGTVVTLIILGIQASK